MDASTSSPNRAAPAPAAPERPEKDKARWKKYVLKELRKKYKPMKPASDEPPRGPGLLDESELPAPLYKPTRERTIGLANVPGPRPPQPRAKVPTKADFEWIRVIGCGSYGRVSIARHKVSGDLVAIKALSKVTIVREQEMENVKQERAMLARVSGHPFFISLVSSFQDVDNLYLVMDYVPGGEFYSYIRKHAPLTNKEARFYAAQIVLALEHLHSKSIVYRDLKPENMLVDADGYLRLTDLGFAKIVKGRTFTMCGTPDYLAPEVISGKGHNVAVDWWSLGCVIYEMLVGHPPFYTGRTQATYRRIMAHDLHIPPDVGPEAADIISKLIESDPRKRLGGSPSGAEAVKSHEWFDGLEFCHVASKIYLPPYVPKLKSADDTRNFSKYDNLAPIESGNTLTPAEQLAFRDWNY